MNRALPLRKVCTTMLQLRIICACLQTK